MRDIIQVRNHLSVNCVILDMYPKTGFCSTKQVLIRYEAQEEDKLAGNKVKSRDAFSS